VDKAGEIMLEKGAKRVLPVKVSGPFHTSLMKPAGDALRERFQGENFGEMQFPVLFNALGGEKGAEDTIPALLEKQVQSSVYFEDSIKYMAEQGIDTIVEIGPGKALSKFVKKTCPDIVCYNVEKAEDVDALVAALQ
jgi:[acyl-carrier-protein] S-malonyltransferase